MIRDCAQENYFFKIVFRECRIVAITPAFQAGDVGSIPITRSDENNTLETANYSSFFGSSILTRDRNI